MPKVSVVQNFICDLPARLEVIERNTPLVGDVWGDYEFFVNFNSTKNNDEVHNIYKKYIPNLNYYNNLEKDWAGIMLAMVNEIKTPYTIYLNEDMEFNMSKEDWENIMNECFVENDIDYILLNKIEKYNKGAFVDGYFPDHINNHAQAFWGQYPAPKYGEGNHVWFYDGKFARHKRVSVDAVYKTEWLKDRLEEFLIKGDSCTHDIPFRKKHICHFYEGYYDFWNGMVRFADMKCAIPKNDIIIHFEDVKQNEYHPQHPDNIKKG